MRQSTLSIVKADMQRCAQFTLSYKLLEFPYSDTVDS